MPQVINHEIVLQSGPKRTVANVRLKSPTRGIVADGLNNYHIGKLIIRDTHSRAKDYALYVGSAGTVDINNCVFHGLGGGNEYGARINAKVINSRSTLYRNNGNKASFRAYGNGLQVKSIGDAFRGGVVVIGRGPADWDIGDQPCTWTIINGYFEIFDEFPEMLVVGSKAKLFLINCRFKGNGRKVASTEPGAKIVYDSRCVIDGGPGGKFRPVQPTDFKHPEHVKKKAA